MSDNKKKPGKKKKLTLNRERVRTLTENELANAAGGRSFTDTCLSTKTITGTCTVV